MSEEELAQMPMVIRKPAMLSCAPKPEIVPVKCHGLACRRH